MRPDRDKRRRESAGSLFVGLLVMAAASEAQPQAPPEGCFPDGHGEVVCFPLGSFADEVVEYVAGDPPAANAVDREPSSLLGAPDYADSGDGASVTLGCGGSVTVRFTDNAIVDVPGADLHLFEVGPSEEPTRLEISSDGTSWVYVGRVWGGRAAVDIAWATRPGETFRYARMTDLEYDCRSRWPGADIDAIGAIGSAHRLSLDSSVLFDVDSDVLRAEARPEIERVAEGIAEADAIRVIIEGHTDSDASEEYNLALSRRRAEAVRAALDRVQALGSEIAVEVEGHGESRPVAPNDTPSNKQKNRRVEIVVIPASAPDVVHGDPSVLDATRPGVHGEWTRGSDRMTVPLPQDGQVRATYTSDGGRIVGAVEGHVIEGYWIEDDSNVACDTEKDGSRHWGRVRLEFDEDFVRYEAKWSYCEEEDWRGDFSGRWTG